MQFLNVIKTRTASRRYVTCRIEFAVQHGQANAKGKLWRELLCIDSIRIKTIGQSSRPF